MIEQVLSDYIKSLAERESKNIIAEINNITFDTQEQTDYYREQVFKKLVKEFNAFIQLV